MENSTKGGRGVSKGHFPLKIFFFGSKWPKNQFFNTKSTDDQGKLKPRSVNLREEGELGFLIIPRAQPVG